MVNFVPTSATEKAFHEYGVNFLWVSMIRRGQMMQAIRNLTFKHRDEMRIGKHLYGKK
ncbi:hypothetical protein ACFL9T_23345 [Thermodesulfobacteriota bacterium]